MGNSTWMVVALVLVGVLIFGVMGQLLSPNSGDAEFQKALDAMEKVKTFRSVYASTMPDGQRSEQIWEVDCNRVFVHRQYHDVGGADASYDSTRDELLIGDMTYTRAGDGSWKSTGRRDKIHTAEWFCGNVADGTVRDPLPDIRSMLRSAMIGKSDKKTVNGIRCRDWKFVMKSSTSGQQGSVCIGLEDHLPYEMTTDGSSSRYTYLDYNAAIALDLPDAALQPASASGGTN